VVRIPGPSWMEKRWISKIFPKTANPHHPRCSVPRDDLLLEPTGEVHEIVAVPSHPHHEVLEILGPSLRFSKELGAYHVELHMVPAQIEEDPDELGEFFLSLLRLPEDLGKAFG